MPYNDREPPDLEVTPGSLCLVIWVVFLAVFAAMLLGGWGAREVFP